MTVFTRPLPTCRLVAIQHGDTLQHIAAREMGDASRWVELAWINSLIWPYITNDPRRAGASVLLAGEFIKVPASRGIQSGTADAAQVFERDCKMDNRRLTDDGAGDFVVVAGSKNLVQQLTHRIATPRGQAIRHPRYGSLLYRLIGKVARPVINVLAVKYTEATLLADYRVNSVTDIEAVIVNDMTRPGDAVSVYATAQTIAGGPVDLSIGRQP